MRPADDSSGERPSQRSLDSWFAVHTGAVIRRMLPYEPARLVLPNHVTFDSEKDRVLNEDKDVLNVATRDPLTVG